MATRAPSKGVRVSVFLFVRSRRIQDTTKRGPRINRQIRISPLRVIGADGAQLGVIEVDVALNMAAEAGLDLVEVSPPYDTTGATAISGAHVAYELICLYHWARTQR